MTGAALLQCGIYLVLLFGLAWPLGLYMARVYSGEARFMTRVLGPLERLLYRLGGVDAAAESGWRGYAGAFLLFSLAGFLAVYGLQRLQGWLPLNPRHQGAVRPDLAFNTAVSFVTNTNWQAYAGEATLSDLTQMLGLTVQNFASAAAGMAVAVALIRGFARRGAATIGNFWVDLVRGTLYILLPLSLVLALLFVSQGVVQNLAGPVTVRLVDASAGAPPGAGVTQVIPRGPVASQEAIKQLGTNGGGFFNANSAHPFENPTAFSNLLGLLAILVIAAGFCVMFGRLVGDGRQGAALLAVMGIVLLLGLAATQWAEQRGNPALGAATLVDQGAGADRPGGNMEGKEARFGITGSVLWAVTTTAASNGSVNTMHDSLTPLGGLVPLALIQLGEVVFGGVGSGLYGMLVFALVAVFMAGLMVGRTPEYLGKKLEAFEMKMAALVILVPAGAVLLGTALAVSVAAGRAGVANPGAHGFSEILYAFSSAANNNGSAFAGLGANTPFYNVALGLAMLIGRFGTALPVLAIAGALAAKKSVPAGPGTLATHTPLFVGLLTAVVLIVGALTFVPALALGPVVEHLTLFGAR